MTLTYGKTTPTSYADAEVRAINRGTARLGRALLPGAYAVDALPLLRYVPLYPGARELRRFHREELALYHELVRGVREKVVRVFCCP